MGAKPLESFWLISTSLSAQQVYDRVKAKTDANDRLIVIRVCNDYQGWLAAEVHDWIRDNVPRC